MNILILNGSPKGADSITLHTALYLEKLHPEHKFEILHVGQRIKALEKDFSPALDALKAAELIIFAYPVYTFVAPLPAAPLYRTAEGVGHQPAGQVCHPDFYLKALLRHYSPPLYSGQLSRYGA